jgi:hypothetical protein
MSKAYIDNKGVARWESNNRVVPADSITPDFFQMPGFDFNATFVTRQKETDEFLAEYRRNRAKNPLSFEDQAEAMNELGPGAVDVITGKSVFTKDFLNRFGVVPVASRRPGRPNAARRKAAAPVLNNIAEKQTVTFPYNGQKFTAIVESVNTTTATVTITKVEGASNNPRKRPILPGAKGVRVPASILARSL